MESLLVLAVCVVLAFAGKAEEGKKHDTNNGRLRGESSDVHGAHRRTLREPEQTMRRTFGGNTEDIGPR